MLRTNLQEKSLLVYLGSSDEHIAYTDLSMMSTVVRNLLSNAIKFSHPGTSISIRTYRDSETVKVTIQDEGIGMTREMQAQLFELGSAQRQTGTCNEKGSGLGLLLSNEFVRLCGGELAVESAPQKGTTFTISLPAEKNNTL